MALRRAAQAGHADKVKELLSRRANVHDREKYGGYTPLHYAANAAVARLLLDARADPEEKSYANTTPLQLARRRGTAELVKLLESVEVEEAVRQARLQARRQLAAQEFADCLVSRGVPDLEMWEALPEEVKAELRQDERLRRLAVQACAVQEVEVLLGLKPAAGIPLREKLVSAIEADAVDEVLRISSSPASDLLQRDPRGNLPAHHCRSVGMYRALIAKEPRSADVYNKVGCSPLDCLWEHSHSLLAMQELWCGGPPPTGGDERPPPSGDVPRLLRLDPSGVSICMRADSKVKEWLLEQMSPWDDVQRQLKMPDGLPDSLHKLVPEHCWREVLAFHLFGDPDIWKGGTMSSQCQGRLEEIWACMKQLLHRARARSSESEARRVMEALDVLLQVTMGPSKLADSRASYRKELSLEMTHLIVQSEAIHDFFYATMPGQASNWLKGFLGEGSLERRTPGQKLRVDCEVAEKKRCLVPPPWLEPDAGLDLLGVLRDLERAGGGNFASCLGGGPALSREGTTPPGDAVYRMLEAGHGFGPDAFPGHLAAVCEPSIVFWYILWLRGICSGRHATIMQALQGSLRKAGLAVARAGHALDRDGNFFPAPDVESVGDLCRAALEEMRDAFDEDARSGSSEGDADDDREARIRRLLTTSPSFLVGLNKATLILEEPDGIAESVSALRTAHGALLQVDNAYHKQAAPGLDGRSLKVLVPVKVGKSQSIIAEVTMMLADDFWEKSWQRLPSDYFRGRFDRHVQPERPPVEAFEQHIKGKFQLNPALIPEGKAAQEPDEVDEETQRRMREMQELKAREAERLAQEEARKKREELERKLKEASVDFDPRMCETVGSMTIRPPVEVLPKTKRSEAYQIRKLDQWHKKKDSL